MTRSGSSSASTAIESANVRPTRSKRVLIPPSPTNSTKENALPAKKAKKVESSLAKPQSSTKKIVQPSPKKSKASGGESRYCDLFRGRTRSVTRESTIAEATTKQPLKSRTKDNVHSSSEDEEPPAKRRASARGCKTADDVKSLHSPKKTTTAKAMEKDKDLSTIFTETPLSTIKEAKGGYLPAGIYSSEFKLDSSKRRKRDGGFKLELPLHWGQNLIDKQRDFELSYDLVKMVGTPALEIILGGLTTEKPSKFQKIPRSGLLFLLDCVLFSFLTRVWF